MLALANVSVSVMMGSNYVNGKQIVLLKQRVQTNVRVVLAIAMILALFTGQHATYAATQTNSANTLKVSPVRTDIQIAAGATKTVQTTVTNLTKNAITISAIENDFVAGDEGGTPALILDANQYAPTHSLKRFMTPIANVTIPASQAKTINVGIAVPKTAQAGGYFGAVRFAPANPDGGGQVNLSASVASLILLTVPGPATEKMTLTNFDIQQGGKTGSNFRSSNDLQMLVRFQNDGNLQEGPTGQVAVKQGDKVVYTKNFNDADPRDMVLPDSARRWTIPLENIGSFGQYTVIGTFTYGTKNETIQVMKTFWVIPWGVIIGTAVAVVVLIGLIVMIWLFLRGYKRRILKKSTRGGGGYRR